MKLYRLHQATNEVERLGRKYRDIWRSVNQFERLLSHGQIHGHSLIPNLRLQRNGQPASIWKSRVIYPPLGGKSSGLRYVYERVQLQGEDYAVALTIYVHQEGGSEAGVIARIREHSASFDATPDGLRKLDGSDTESLLR